MQNSVWRRVSSSVLGLALAVAGLTSPGQAQEYASSVVGTDFDFIQDEDPDAFLCLEFKFRGRREMPDKRGPTKLVQEAFVFLAHFSDGTRIDIAIDTDFGSEERAREEALRYTPRLGRLPTALRRGVKRLVVHAGGRDTTAFSDVGLIVVYAENATKRISTHDLEETIFHESVHAAWDKEHADSLPWREAQAADAAFLTHYGQKKPGREDLAESALFAYTVLHHPERIPTDARDRIVRTIPARIEFVRKLLPPGEPTLHEVAPKYACDGSSTTFQVDGADSGECAVNITLVGVLSDILSNALVRGMDRDSKVVTSFLVKAKKDCSTADELLEATMAEFGIDRATLDAKVEEYFHCNCSHDDAPQAEDDNDE